jgi:PucR C-terminal helix-turn-helix domain/GGDEF-like domain
VTSPPPRASDSLSSPSAAPERPQPTAPPPPSIEQRRVEQVRRLLAGEPVDAASFAYPFEGCHVGAVARGAEARRVTDALSELLGCRHLAVRCDDGTVWAWLGQRARPDLRRLDRLATARLPTGTSLALGEVGYGLAGWRRSHRQARAAFLVAARRPGSPIRYADVALLASIAQDDLLAASLHQLYLAPLREERDGGATLRATLRAWFAAGRNGASAAAALKVSRQTVTNRLQAVEVRLGRPLISCATAIEAALGLEELRLVLDPARNDRR